MQGMQNKRLVLPGPRSVHLEMKYNLKNRPKPRDYMHPDEINSWFEGFEKELREKLAIFEKENRSEWADYPLGITSGMKQQIKEILGEEK